jgi:hypothetical protein
MVEKDALMLIRTIITKANNNLTEGGLKLSAIETELIKQTLKIALDRKVTINV